MIIGAKLYLRLEIGSGWINFAEGQEHVDVEEEGDCEDDERLRTKIRILVLTNNWLVGFIPSIFAEGELLAWIYLLFAFHFQCLPTKET